MLSRRRRANGRSRQRRDAALGLAVAIGAAATGLALSRWMPQGGSVAHGSQQDHSGAWKAVRVDPDPLPEAPSVVAAVPKQKDAPRPAAPVTAVPATPPEVLPPAPSLVSAPKTAAPAAPAPSVVAAPVVPVPTAPAAPVVAAPQAAPPAPAPAVTTAPQEQPDPPKPAPAVTSAPGWEETVISKRAPRIRVYNDTPDGGRSRLLLNNGRLRRGFMIRHPYGQIDLPPGEYRYELYFAGSAVAPLPDQVGIIRCRTYRMYSFRLFTQPVGPIRRQDLGDY